MTFISFSSFDWFDSASLMPPSPSYLLGNGGALSPPDAGCSGGGGGSGNNGGSNNFLLATDRSHQCLSGAMCGSSMGGPEQRKLSLPPVIGASVDPRRKLSPSMIGSGSGGTAGGGGSSKCQSFFSNIKKCIAPSELFSNFRKQP